MQHDGATGTGATDKTHRFVQNLIIAGMNGRMPDHIYSNLTTIDDFDMLCVS